MQIVFSCNYLWVLSGLDKRQYVYAFSNFISTPWSLLTPLRLQCTSQPASLRYHFRLISYDPVVCQISSGSKPKHLANKPLERRHQQGLSLATPRVYITLKPNPTRIRSSLKRRRQWRRDIICLNSPIYNSRIHLSRDSQTPSEVCQAEIFCSSSAYCLLKTSNLDAALEASSGGYSFKQIYNF